MGNDDNEFDIVFAENSRRLATKWVAASSPPAEPFLAPKGEEIDHAVAVEIGSRVPRLGIGATHTKTQHSTPRQSTTASKRLSNILKRKRRSGQSDTFVDAQPNDCASASDEEDESRSASVRSRLA